MLKPGIDSGKIKNVCETFTDGWKPDNAQKEMEQCLTKQNNKVDAVVSENDGMASGVVAALKAQGMAGSVPVSGQDGDLAAINRVALGTQTVSIWKDARELGKAAAEAAVALGRRQEVGRHRRRKPFADGPKDVKMDGILLDPARGHQGQARRDRRKGWITKDKACAGVKKGSV